MTAEEKPPSGPDLSAGVAISQIPDGGMLLGHVGGEAALFARRGEEIFAIGATCTHYGGPSRKGSSSATRSDAPGTTPASD